MKRLNLFMMMAALIYAAVLTSCDPNEKIPLILVGPQESTLTEGTPSVTTFRVGTAHIDVSKPGTVQWYSDTLCTVPTSLPTGISPHVSSGNSDRILTITATYGAETGRYYFRVIIDGVQSLLPSELVVSPSTTKSVSVMPQDGVIMAGTAGTAVYRVTTANIDTSLPGVIKWYTENGITLVDPPVGLDTMMLTTGNANRLMTFETNSGMTAGTYYFKLTIDNVVSNLREFVIWEERTKFITVGDQNGRMTAGVPGKVTYPVKTEGFEDGVYHAEAATLPQGVTVAGGTVKITAGAGTLTLEGDNTTIAGRYYRLILTLDDAYGYFELVIDPGGADVERRVLTEQQKDNIEAGKPGTVTYPVKTENFADGEYTATVTDPSLPQGVTVAGKVTIFKNEGILTLACSSSTQAGRTENLYLTLDGVRSLKPFNLVIDPGIERRVLTEQQKDKIEAGKPGTVTYPVKTENFADGEYTATVTDPSLPQGVTVAGKVTIFMNEGILTLACSSSTQAGTTNNLYLTLDGVRSLKPFSLVIDPGLTKIVEAGLQLNKIKATTPDTVRCPVTTQNFADGRYVATVLGLPTGVTVADVVEIVKGEGILKLACNASTQAGTTNDLWLTLDGVRSLKPFSLVIDPVGADVERRVLTEQQKDNIEAGKPGTVTYPVKTEHFADGEYTATVTDPSLPTGVTVAGKVTIVKNEGILTLACSASTQAGTTDNLYLTLDGVRSLKPFSLVIDPGAERRVQTEQQKDNIEAGKPGTVTYPVKTEHFADGEYTATVTNPSLPTGVTIAGKVTIVKNEGILTLACSASTQAGRTDNLYLTLDGVRSLKPFSLVIDPGVRKSVNVGSQEGQLTAGMPGSVKFPVKTEGIANGDYQATVRDLPMGVTITGVVSIQSGSGYLTLTGNYRTTVGITSTLRLTIDNTLSGNFTLTIQSIRP